MKDPFEAVQKMKPHPMKRNHPWKSRTTYEPLSKWKEAVRNRYKKLIRILWRETIHEKPRPPMNPYPNEKNPLEAVTKNWSASYEEKPSMENRLNQSWTIILWIQIHYEDPAIRNGTQQRNIGNRLEWALLILSNDRPFLEFFKPLPYAVVLFFGCLQKRSGAVKYKSY